MAWYKDFKDFALRSSMIDLALGVILGTAFGRVVNSLVNDVLMPPIGFFLGGVDFSDLSVKFSVPEIHHPPVEIKYGLFINSLIDLSIMLFVIFFVIKLMSQINIKSQNLEKKKECPECLMVIPIKAKKCCYCCTEFSV